LLEGFFVTGFLNQEVAKHKIKSLILNKLIISTSGTHITVVERVANSSHQMKQVLGDPMTDPDSPDGIKMRFAKLGSIGPDIYYAMAGRIKTQPAVYEYRE
jgi:hypothetical protein